MPSDFTSLFSADIDLDSPKSLYSKESVYDLLPKELQLPSSREQNAAAMSQKSGGEAGPPPSTAVAADGSSASSAMSMGSPRSAFSTSSTSASERITHSGREKGGQQTQQQHQMTPSKRPVLNISPPPEDLFDESNISCQDELLLDSEQSNSIWMENSVSNFSIVSSSSYNDNTEVPRKARKCTPRQKPGPKPVPAEEASMDVFDADSAKGPHFVLSQLGPDSKTCSKASSDGPQASGLKGGILSCQYPQKSEGKELKIVVQPETQHRARYLTEGSRGSVKDRTQQGFPTIKLEGVKESVVLQIFVGNDAGRVKPHGFYQACRVTGRNTTACREVDIEGTTVIEVPLDPSSNMTLPVDCVGILKLRNADVEARIGVAGSKKKSTRARLVFRVNIPRPDGSVLTLQTSSSPILCTQPAGVPEILKKSLHSCSVKGGSEVFIIGKNFLKGTKVIFQENASDDKSWKAEADIDMEFFHQNHLIVKVPPYQNPAITSPVSVGIYIVTNAGRSHDIQPFTYTPEPVVDSSVKKEVLPPVTPCCFEQIKGEQTSLCLLALLIDTALMTPVLPLVKREEVTPMEVSSNPSAFKTSEVINSAQQALDMSAEISTNNCKFSSSLAHQTREQDQSQNSVFPNKEPFSTIQEQNLTPSGSFHVPNKSLLQQGVQPFLLEHRESLGQERTGNSGSSVVGLSQIDDNSQQQLSLLPPDEVAQLEQAVRQLQAKGFCNIHLQSENSLSKQRQHQLHQQHQQIQQQQQQIQQQQQQIQQQQQHIQHQEQQIQLQQQQHQQQQALENLQHQLFQPQVQIHCSSEQQSPSQGMVENGSSLCQQAPSQQQQRQQASLFQQAQPGSMFQSMSQSPSKLPHGQQQQAGLLLGSLNSPVTQEQTSNLLFGGQVQIGSMNNSSLASPEQQSTSLPFSQTGMVTVRQQESSEPMTFQDQTTMVVSPSSNKPIFQDQQPMQLAPSSGTAPSQSVNLFMAQSGIQGGMASQEPLFTPQSDVSRIQTSTSSPVQQPGQLFQTTMSGSLNQPNQNQQPDLFLFEIQNECSQLMNSQGSTLSDQIIAINQSGQSQQESEGQIQSLLGQSLPDPGTVQSTLTTSQNMEKIDDLLVSLQEQSNNISHSY
uniref:Nuclear factor of activated T-cells 5 n=1 Tax=Cyprinus carpio TaxID=7962 RepID=A0A8C2DYH5_CYPCA